MQQHRDLPFLPLLQAITLLVKGVAIIGYNLVLLTYKLAGMRKAIAALLEQRSSKTSYI
jgi:Na+-transporting methylmalonyl-CoA/oxaloacetate decarboxylase gamma subunit